MAKINNKTPKRVRQRQTRQGPRRALLASRLTRLIFLSNLVGLLILVAGALTMTRFEDGLIQAKVDNLQSLAATITTVLGEQATGSGGRAELDVAGAKQVLRGINVPKGWRVRLHDRAGNLVADTDTLNQTIETGLLEPIIPEQIPPTKFELIKSRSQKWVEETAHNLPWRQSRRARLRRNLGGDVRQTLEGKPQKGPRYNAEDNLIVTVSLPVQRVQRILGAVTVESNDVSSIVNAERRALAPIIGLAFGVMVLSSLALTLFITLPMRKLARAAEQVSRSSDKRDAIPDLSKRRDEIGDLSLVMKEMTSGLYSRIDDIANFAADVAHEIKNPLTSLRSASDTLRVAKTDEQREQLIKIIQQDVSRMDRLITDISKASKVDANLARETAEVLNIADIIHNVVDFYQQTHSKDGVQIRDKTQTSENDHVFIRAFETPFAQVLRNLIDNALTFSPPQGTVTIWADIQTDQKKDSVIITIEDEGPGIPPDNLETVFDRFYTQRPKGAKFGNHSGLGLAICRQIITAHKGTIKADNRINETSGEVAGARFIINLPRHILRSN